MTQPKTETDELIEEMAHSIGLISGRFYIAKKMLSVIRKRYDLIPKQLDITQQEGI